MKSSFQKHQHDFYFIWSQTNILYCRWAERAGVNYTTFITLYGLDVHGSMTQKSICDFYGFPKQTVNGIIRSLTKKGYVTLKASERDRREKLVCLTETGQTYPKELLSPLYHAEQYAFCAAGDKKIAQTIDTIDIFNTFLKKRLEEMI